MQHLGERHDKTDSPSCSLAHRQEGPRQQGPRPINLALSAGVGHGERPVVEVQPLNRPCRQMASHWDLQAQDPGFDPRQGLLATLKEAGLVAVAAAPRHLDQAPGSEPQ